MAASLTRALAPSSQSLWGKWTLKSRSDGATLLVVRFRYGNSFDGSEFYLRRPGNANGASQQANDMRSFSLQFVRLLVGPRNVPYLSSDSGAFNLVGFDGRRNAGDVLFVPNSDFATSLHAKGLAVNNRQSLQLGLAGASVQDVELTKAAFPDADVATVSLLKMSRQNVQSAVTLRQLVPTMTARDLAVFLGRNITPSYVLDLRTSGLNDLTPADVSNLKSAHVDGAFVRSQTKSNIVPSVSKLLQAKNASSTVKATR